MNAWIYADIPENHAIRSILLCFGTCNFLCLNHFYYSFLIEVVQRLVTREKVGLYQTDVFYFNSILLKYKILLTKLSKVWFIIELNETLSKNNWILLRTYEYLINLKFISKSSNLVT